MSTRLGVPGWGYPAGPAPDGKPQYEQAPRRKAGCFLVWVGSGSGRGGARRQAVEAGRVGKPSRRGACQRLTARTNVPLSLWVRPLSLWVRRHGDKTSAVCDESIVLFNPLFNPLFNLALNCCVREAAKKAKATHGI